MERGKTSQANSQKRKMALALQAVHLSVMDLVMLQCALPAMKHWPEMALSYLYRLDLDRRRHFALFEAIVLTCVSRHRGNDRVRWFLTHRLFLWPQIEKACAPPCGKEFAELLCSAAWTGLHSPCVNTQLLALEVLKYEACAPCTKGLLEVHTLLVAEGPSRAARCPRIARGLVDWFGVFKGADFDVLAAIFQVCLSRHLGDDGVRSMLPWPFMINHIGEKLALPVANAVLLHGNWATWASTARDVDMCALFARNIPAAFAEGNASFWAVPYPVFVGLTPVRPAIVDAWCEVLRGRSEAVVRAWASMAPSYLKEVVLLQFACTAPAPYLLQSALDSYEHRVHRMNTPCRVNGTFWEQCVTKTVVAVWEQQGKLGAAVTATATAAALALLGAVSWGWQDSTILVDIVTSSCTSGLLCPGIIVCVKSLVGHRLDVDDHHKTAPVVVSWLETIMQCESELLALCSSMDVLGNIVDIACDIYKIVDSETHPDVASGLFSVRVACKLLCLGVARYGPQHATCISGLFFDVMFHANLCPVTCATVVILDLQGALDSLIQGSALVLWKSCLFFAWVLHKCNLLAAPVRKDAFVHPVDTAWNTRLWNVLNDSIPFLGRIHRPWVENWMMELIPSLCEMPAQLNNLSSALQQAVIQQVVCDRDRDRAAGGHTYCGYANLPPPVLMFFFLQAIAQDRLPSSGLRLAWLAVTR
jgi:hypothetical protein